MEARFARVVPATALLVCAVSGYRQRSSRPTPLPVTRRRTSPSRRRRRSWPRRSATRPRCGGSSSRSNGSARRCRRGRSRARSTRRLRRTGRRRGDELRVRPRRSLRLEDEHPGLARADSRLGVAARSDAHDLRVALPPAAAALGRRRRLHDGRASQRNRQAGAKPDPVPEDGPRHSVQARCSR